MSDQSNAVWGAEEGTWCRDPASTWGHICSPNNYQLLLQIHKTGSTHTVDRAEIPSLIVKRPCRHCTELISVVPEAELPIISTTKIRISDPDEHYAHHEDVINQLWMDTLKTKKLRLGSIDDLAVREQWIRFPLCSIRWWLCQGCLQNGLSSESLAMSPAYRFGLLGMLTLKVTRQWCRKPGAAIESGCFAFMRLVTILLGHMSTSVVDFTMLQTWKHYR